MGTFSIRQLDLFYGEFQALKDISIDLPEMCIRDRRIYKRVNAPSIKYLVCKVIISRDKLKRALPK